MEERLKYLEKKKGQSQTNIHAIMVFKRLEWYYLKR